MEKMLKNKKLIINILLALGALLIVIYILTRLFGPAAEEHIVPTPLSPYFLVISDNLQIRWYAVCILSGAIFVAVLSYFRIFRYIRFDSDTLLTALVIGLFVGIAGARIYYIIFDHGSLPDDFFEALKEIVGLGPNGLSGLAIHGGIYATIIYLIVYCKIKKIKLLAIVEIVLPCFMLAQVIGRWGNFFNQEAFGPLVNGYEIGPLTEEQLLAQRLTLQRLLVPDFVIDNMYLTPYGLNIPKITGYYYPTFYFESVLNLIGVSVYFILRRKTNKVYLGDAAGFYLTWYGIVRFIIESMRTDPLMLGNIRIAQLTSVLFFIGGVTILILRRVLKYRLIPCSEFFQNGTIWLDENKDPFKEKAERMRIEAENKKKKGEGKIEK